MAGLMSFPQRGQGLLGRAPYRTQDPLLTMMLDRALMQPPRSAPPPAEYSTQDPMMTRMLDQERRQPARDPSAAMPPMTQPAPGGALATPARPQRARVSGWRMLDRVLGGQTITEGLDEERARLEGEARRPQMEADQERINSVIRGLPMEQQLAIMFNKDKAGEAFASQFTDRSAAAGTSIVRGPNAIYTTPTTTFDGGRFATSTPGANGAPAQVSYSEARPMSYPEITAQSVAETGRINATNPISVSANADLVDPITRQTVAQGYRPPDIANIAPGGTAQVFRDGQPTASVVSSQQRPMSNAEQTAIDDLETSITVGSGVIGRVQGVISQITGGAFELNPVATTSYRARNATGNSSPQSLAYAAALTTVNELRNALLRDNKGTQTEGDAIRTLDEVIAGWGDEKVVKQGLQRFVGHYGQLQQTRQTQLERRQSGDARRPGAQTTPPPATPPPAGGQPSRAAILAELRRRGEAP